MQELKQRQVSGEELQMTGGNGSEKGYKIRQDEAHLVHARIATPRFDPVTGEDKGRSRIATFTPKDFKDMEAAGTFNGQKVTILHDGGEPIADIEPEDGLIVKQVSGPGAGLPVGVDYTKMSAAKLKKVYAELFPGEQNPPTDKTDLIEAIQARNQYLADEEQQKQAAQIDRNRLGADAEKKQQEALKAATTDVKQDAPGSALQTTAPTIAANPPQPGTVTPQTEGQQGSLLDENE